MPHPAPHTSASTPGRKSTIYVLTRFAATKATLDSSVSYCDQLLRDHLADIVPGSDLERGYAAYVDQVTREQTRLRNWFAAFETAWTSGAPEVPRTNPTKKEPNLPRGDRSRWTWTMKVAAEIIAAGPRGVTQAELTRRFDTRSNGPSGSLTTLHQSGLIARLTATRL